MRGRTSEARGQRRGHADEAEPGATQSQERCGVAASPVEGSQTLKGSCAVQGGGEVTAVVGFRVMDEAAA